MNQIPLQQQVQVRIFLTKILNASEARAKFFSLVEQVNQDHLPRFITSRQGKDVTKLKGANLVSSLK